MIRSRNRARGGGGGISFIIPSLIQAGKLTVLDIGQSLQEYIYTRGTPRTAVYSAEEIESEMGFTPSGRSYQVWAGGVSCSDGSNEAATNYTVKLYNRAAGGSSIWDSPTGAGLAADDNYWWNVYGGNAAVTGDPLDDIPDSAGPLARTAGIVAALGIIDIIRKNQGTTNAASVSNDATQLLFKQTTEKVIDYMRGLTGTNTPVILQQIGHNNVGSDNGHQRIREAYRQIYASKPYIYLLSQEYDLEYAIAEVLTGASYTSGTNTITMTSSVGALGVNNIVTGTGIPDNTWVDNIVGLTITLSANVTSTVAGGTIYRMDGVHSYAGADGEQPLDSNGNTTHNVNKGFYPQRTT